MTVQLFAVHAGQIVARGVFLHGFFGRVEATVVRFLLPPRQLLGLGSAYVLVYFRPIVLLTLDGAVPSVAAFGAALQRLFCVHLATCATHTVSTNLDKFRYFRHSVFPLKKCGQGPFYQFIHLPEQNHSRLRASFCI